MYGWILLGLVCLWLAVILIRAAAFRPGKEELDRTQHPELKIDRDKAAANLSELIRCKTVSHNDQSKINYAEFEKLRRLLKDLYPQTHKTLDFELIGGHAMLYRWKGKADVKPLLLMAHYDVVPASGENWKYPPFEGRIEEGAVWGRGAMDMKSTLCGIFEAVELLLADGYIPATDIYLAFGHDEETMGDGAPAIVEVLRSRGIKPEMVLDEGGAVVEKIFPGVNKPIAAVGMSEKGVANIEFVVEGKGGHASAPGKYTPLTVMSEIVTRVNGHPFKAQLPAETWEMLEILGKQMPFGFRIIFANLWCFKGLVTLLFPMLGKETNAMCRTTCAFTMAEGSSASNVLPQKARTVANLRVAAADSVESALKHVTRQAMIASKKGRKAKDGVTVRVSLVQGHNASPSTSTAGGAYKKLSETVRAVYPEAVVSPYVMYAATDSRHFCAVSDHVLRFSPIEMSAEERGSIHAADERIPVAKLGKMIEFFIRLICR